MFQNSNHIFRTEEVTGIANVATWAGLQTPSHYNPVKLDMIKPRMPDYTQKSKVERFKPWVKTDEPSPQSYKPDDLVSSARRKSP